MAARSRKKQGTEDPQNGGGTQQNLTRPTAQQIYQQVATSGRDEIQRSTSALAISGFAGGIFMGLTGLGTAVVLSILGESAAAHLIAKLFYPVGFVVVIVGRSQLFTENTLYPVALVLAERRHLWATLRLWSIVLPSNILGALTFALLCAYTAALQSPVQHALITLGTQALAHPAATIFWSGVFGGWIIATTAWLVSGSHSVTGSILIIWLLTSLVGLGNFAHCIATSGEILTAVLAGQASAAAYLHWLLFAVLGNICGGVGMVTLIEYGQVIYGGDDEAQRSDNSNSDATSKTVAA